MKLKILKIKKLIIISILFSPLSSNAGIVGGAVVAGSMANTQRGRQCAPSFAISGDIYKDCMNICGNALINGNPCYEQRVRGWGMGFVQLEKMCSELKIEKESNKLKQGE